MGPAKRPSLTYRVRASALWPVGDAVRAVVTDKGGGKYEGRYTVPEGTQVPVEGATWRLAIELHGCGIKGNPFPVLVRSTKTVPLSFVQAEDGIAE